MAFQALEEPADVHAVHQGMMHFDRDGHAETSTCLEILAKDDLWSRVLAIPLPGVREAGEGDPGQDRAMDQIVPVAARLQSASGGAESRHRGTCLLRKPREALLVLEITEG